MIVKNQIFKNGVCIEEETVDIENRTVIQKIGDVTVKEGFLEEEDYLFYKSEYDKNKKPAEEKITELESIIETLIIDSLEGNNV